MRFSQRAGYRQVKSVAQFESMDTDLRNGLWNVFYVTCLNGLPRLLGSDRNSTFVQLMWVKYFKKPIDLMPVIFEYLIEEVRKAFFGSDWYEVYDILEFAAEFSSMGEKLREMSNQVMEEEMSAYRFVGDHTISPIVSQMEIEEVERGLSLSGRFSLSSRHLGRALELLSDKATPDYRNSIKESISAVEAACVVIVGKKVTLGDALKRLQGKMPIHGAFREALSKLYGYTSDAHGIRHALLEEENLSQADARFFLIACSSFVNYIIVNAEN